MNKSDAAKLKTILNKVDALMLSKTISNEEYAALHSVAVKLSTISPTKG